MVSYLGFYTSVSIFDFVHLCLICLYLFLVHFVHHREHDIIFLMKISITYQKKNVYKNFSYFSIKLLFIKNNQNIIIYK